MKMLVALVALVLALVVPAYAWYSSPPSAPSCLDMPRLLRDSDGNIDKFRFRMCRSEMESYKSSVESHIRAVREEFNQNVDKFNCIARGGTIC